MNEVNTESPTIVEVKLSEAPQAQIEQALREEIVALKSEALRQQVASELALSESRLKTASEIAHSKPNETGDNGRADVQLNKAIAACKGLAYWNRLTESQKTAALGIQGSEQTKDSDLRKIFGSSSDGMAAQRLAKASPVEYRRLRMLAKLRNIF